MSNASLIREIKKKIAGLTGDGASISLGLCDGLNNAGTENNSIHAAAWIRTVIHFFSYHGFSIFQKSIFLLKRIQTYDINSSFVKNCDEEAKNCDKTDTDKVIISAVNMPMGKAFCNKTAFTVDSAKNKNR